MLSSQIMLETIEQHLETIFSTLSHDHIKQLEAILSQLTETNDHEQVENIADILFGLCIELPSLKELLAEADRTQWSQNQRLNPKPTEQEKQVQIIANRLIKTIRESQKTKSNQKVKNSL